MADAADRVKRASALVAEAITELAVLGAEAPSNVRDAMQTLGAAYSALGWADPNTLYSIPRRGESYD